MTEHEDTKPPEPPTEESPTRELPPGTEPAPTAGPSGPRRLLRSHDDRVIAGVAGGLGRYFNIDPVIARIAFAVSILFGGLGVIAYIAAALFVPSDDGTGAPAPPRRGRGIALAAGVGLLAIAGLFGFGALVALAAFVTGLGYGLIVAGTVVAIGIVLLALSFRGSAKWLIVPALALSIGVGVAAASDLDLEGGVGDRNYHPASASAIPADGYELGVGQLAVDLRDIDWSSKRVVDLDLRLGAGDLVVAVPSEVCVSADAHAGAGYIEVAGQQADGIDVDLSSAADPGATPQLRLDADVDLGAIRILNDDDVEIDRGHDGFDDLDSDNGDVAREANEAACSR